MRNFIKFWWNRQYIARFQHLWSNDVIIENSVWCMKLKYPFCSSGHKVHQQWYWWSTCKKRLPQSWANDFRSDEIWIISALYSIFFNLWIASKAPFTWVYFWACERNCIYVKVNLHMCKYTPPCKYTPAQTRCIFAYTYMYFIHICIFGHVNAQEIYTRMQM